MCLRCCQLLYKNLTLNIPCFFTLRVLFCLEVSAKDSCLLSGTLFACTKRYKVRDAPNKNQPVNYFSPHIQDRGQPAPEVLSC